MAPIVCVLFLRTAVCSHYTDLGGNNSSPNDTTRDESPLINTITRPFSRLFTFIVVKCCSSGSFVELKRDTTTAANAQLGTFTVLTYGIVIITRRRIPRNEVRLIFAEDWGKVEREGNSLLMPQKSHPLAEKDEEGGGGGGGDAKAHSS